jgi:PAS domain S-box-containing protein
MNERPRVLLVDDELDLAEVSQRILESKYDMDVSIAGSALEGLELLWKGSYDAIVSDYQMPVMNGIEFLRRVRAEHGSMPFILFTGKGRESVVIEALNSGADGYLQKGGEVKSQFAELAHKLETAIGRRRTEAELQEIQERYHALFESSMDCVYVHDLQGHFLDANSAALSLLGYKREEIVGRNLLEILAEGQAELVKEAISGIIRDGSHVGLHEFRLRRKDGGLVDVEVKAALIKHEGRPFGIFGIARDVTERKRIDEAFAQESTLLNAIFNSVPGMIYLYDDQGRLERWNRNHELMTGYSAEELKGMSLLDWYKGDLRSQKAVQDGVASVMKNGFGMAEADLQKKDGSTIPMYFTASLLNVKGKQYFAGIGIDMTETIRAQQELRESREELRDAMELSNLVNWEFDLADNSFLFDDHFFALYGTTQEKEGGQRMKADVYAREFVHPDDAHMVGEEIAKVMAGGDASKCYSVQHRIIRRDGETRFIVVRYKIKLDEKGKVIGSRGANQDITEAKMTELALLRANRNLALLASITRHDTVNQVHIIRGYAGLLQDEGLPPQQREMAEKLDRAASAIQKQVQFAQAYQEIGSQAPGWHSLRAAVGKALGALSPGDLVVEIVPPSYEVRSDPMFERVVYNLIDNCIRHSGGARRLAIRSQERDGRLLISFADDGAGIADEDRGHLFERGFGKNTGYGLFLSREILGITGIQIEERGRQGEGAVFEMTVPRGDWRREK